MDLRLPFGLFPAKLRGLDIVASPTLIAQQGKNQPQILHYVVGKEPRNAIALLSLPNRSMQEPSSCKLDAASQLPQVPLLWHESRQELRQETSQYRAVEAACVARVSRKHPQEGEPPSQWQRSQKQVTARR